MNSKIIGTGSYIPKNIIKNDAFVNHFFLDVNGNKITSKNEEIIGKLEAIGTVLGCMFDPAPCEEKKKQAETEELEKHGNTK